MTYSIEILSEKSNRNLFRFTIKQEGKKLYSEKKLEVSKIIRVAKSIIDAFVNYQKTKEDQDAVRNLLNGCSLAGNWFLKCISNNDKKKAAYARQIFKDFENASTCYVTSDFIIFPFECICWHGNISKKNLDNAYYLFFGFFTKIRHIVKDTENASYRGAESLGVNWSNGKVVHYKNDHVDPDDEEFSSLSSYAKRHFPSAETIPVRTIRDRDIIIDEFTTQSSLRIAHFLCHHEQTNYSLDSRLVFNENFYFSTGELNGIERINDPNKPALIFVNACQGMNLSPFGIHGLVRDFYPSLSHSLVTTYAPILEKTAKTFSEAFYNHFFDFRSIEEALFNARAELLRRGVFAAYAYAYIAISPDLYINPPDHISYEQ